MEIGGCQEIDLELEADDLIGNFQFPETMDAKREANSVGIDVNDRLPELHESTEPESNKRNGRYNLRKSLAWDSAFFTSAGVLDAEELSSMIIKTDKKEKHVLPGIQEELTGSTESISTLQSDSLTLESNEDDLFLDIRASIQRSSKKASTFTNSSSKIAAMVLDGAAISSPKKEVPVSHNKCPKPGVKKTSGLQTVPMSKTQLKPNGKLASGRSIKLDSALSQAGSIGKTGEANSFPHKPLKTISSSVPSSTAAKRESVGTGRVKPECGSSKQGSTSGKVTQPPRVSALGGSRKVLPKPTVSSKCSSVGSSTTSTVHSTRSSTSSDNSISTSSGNAAKPTLMAARRNLGKISNSSTGPSGSIPKTPSRALPKNKLPASTLSAYVKSTKLSSSVSPASSISEWSSASSTTSSVIIQRSNNSTRSSLDTSSCWSVDGDNMCSDPRYKVAGQKAERQGNHGAIPTSNTLKKSSTTSGTLQAPAKPSGLRLPSPKIGFFDGSSSRTPDGNQRSQSALHPVIPKNGAAASTPTRSSNGKLKSAKVPTANMATSLANIKSGSPKAAASPASSREKSHALVKASPATSREKSHALVKASPASSQEKLHALVKASSVSTDVIDSSSLPVGVKFSGIEEIYQEAVEVQAERGVKQVVNEGTGADDTDNSGNLTWNKSMASGDIKTATGEGNYISGSEHINQIGDGLIKKDELEMNSVRTSEAMKEDNRPANYPGEGVIGDQRGTCEMNHEPSGQLLSDASECALSSATAASEAVAPCKSLLEPTELVIPVAVAEYACLALPPSGAEYISQIGDGLIKDELTKKFIPTTGAMEKENDLTNCQGERLTEDNKGVYHEPNCQVLSDTSDHALSSAAACRSPFEPTELVIPVAGEENGLVEDELKKNLIPTSGTVQKENNPTNYQGQGLTEDTKGIYERSEEPNYQLFTDTLDYALSSTAAASEAAACRSPFESTETIIPVAGAESACFALPSSGSEDISQTDDGLVKDELKKNLIPTSGAVEKENDPTNYQGQGSTEDKKGVYEKSEEPNCQHVGDTSDYALSSTAAASGAAACRSPFEPTETVIPVAGAESACFALPSSGSEDISQTDDGLVKDELKKNLIPTSGAVEKENDPTSCQGQGLTEDKKGVYQKSQEPNCQLISDTSAASEAAVYRSPFAPKNFSCSDESTVNKSTELVIPVAAPENAVFALPCAEKENC